MWVPVVPLRLLSLASFAFTYLDGPTFCLETVLFVGLDQVDEAGCQKIQETHMSPSPNTGNTWVCHHDYLCLNHGSCGAKLSP